GDGGGAEDEAEPGHGTWRASRSLASAHASASSLRRADSAANAACTARRRAVAVSTRRGSIRNPCAASTSAVLRDVSVIPHPTTTNRTSYMSATALHDARPYGPGGGPAPNVATGDDRVLGDAT